MTYTFKLIVAGDGGVGKTALLNRFCVGKFSEDVRITLGVQFRGHQLIINNNEVNLQICDFGGMDCFRHILPVYCRGAHGALFLYDVTSPASLYHMDNWVSVLRSQGRKFPIIAGGTKADLIDSKKVPIEDAIAFAKRAEISKVMEVSAKTGQNIAPLFETICVQMMNYSLQELTHPYQEFISQLVNVIK